MKFSRIFVLYAFLVFAITGSACSLGAQLTGGKDPTATRPRHFAVLPPAPTVPSNSAPEQEALPALTSPLPAPSDPTTLQPGEQPPPAEAFPAPTDMAYAGEPTPLLAPEVGQAPPALPTATPFLPRPRPTATPTPDSLLAQLSELLFSSAEPTATPTRPLRLAALPTIPPTPTATPTFTSSPTPTETPIPTATPLPPPVEIPTLPPPADTPVPLPANPPAPEPPPVAAAPPPAAPAESAFTSPPPVSASTFSSPAAAAPADPATSPVAPATSGYDFLLAEFYNSPTTNSFIVIYVAIVDANEIPIGDMKVVGTRLDHNLTYESPLSTWHFEGYNAPGEVIKSGNVKFEPPGGIETTNWVLHLEDAQGNRVSEDVPFDTKQEDKQWYFIKFKRKF